MSTNYAKIITVKPYDEGVRIDNYILKKCKEMPFFLVQKLLRTGQIRVDGHRVKGSLRLQVGNKVRIPSSFILPVKVSINDKISNSLTKKIKDQYILFRDSNIIAINKPAGLSVQGGTKIKYHIDGLLDNFKFDLENRPKLVHRLDKETSGVLLLARTPIIARRLTKAFKNKEISKNYVAVVHGKFPKSNGEINIPLEKISFLNSGKSEMTAKDTKQAVTKYNVLWKGKFENNIISIVEFIPITGRKHQIRAHAYHVGCPIIGDKKYYIKSKNSGCISKYYENMFLHAKELGVPDLEGITIRIKAPFPSYMTKLFSLIGFRGFDNE